ncbi:hypothetical protein GE061_014228 [Apolygus lucorum]|uniref:Anaphase-promoting complex subunit 11 RING-H2 finger domain-containing protein n=1 Tax=Apolygus lucorum TaxID=248454 RepID=A0A8S9XR65_APOLU|nr:hypothetical protein GE061_014228 [Apolygus lucorum]
MFALPITEEEVGNQKWVDSMSMSGDGCSIAYKFLLFQFDVSSVHEESLEPSKNPMKVVIKSWNGVATWRWLANDDTCGICRLAFDGCCPDCKVPGDECPLVWDRNGNSGNRRRIGFLTNG